MELLPDYLQPGLDIVFMGAAPSLKAAETGHYYAGSRNRFWLLLHQSGLTSRLLDSSEDRTVLQYGIGLTAIFKNQISSDNAGLPEPSSEQRKIVHDKLLSYNPKIVCFNGKDVYRMFYGEDAPRWGLLTESFGESLQFVVHSSSGRADRWGADRLHLYKELAGLARDE